MATPGMLVLSGSSMDQCLPEIFYEFPFKSLIRRYNPTITIYDNILFLQCLNAIDSLISSVLGQKEIMEKNDAFSAKRHELNSS